MGPVRKKAAGLGYPVFAFDFRNGGDSQERRYPGNRRCGADVAAAVKAVRRLGATKVFSVGASLGGSAVLQATANVRPPVTSVVSVSGAAELVDAIAAVRRVEVPAPYLADDHDTPFQNDARRLFAATAARDKTLKFIAGRARQPARRRERRGRATIEAFLSRSRATPASSCRARRIARFRDDDRRGRKQVAQQETR